MPKHCNLNRSDAVPYHIAWLPSSHTPTLRQCMLAFWFSGISAEWRVSLELCPPAAANTPTAPSLLHFLSLLFPFVPYPLGLGFLCGFSGQHKRKTWDKVKIKWLMIFLRDQQQQICHINPPPRNRGNSVVVCKQGWSFQSFSSWVTYNCHL